MIRRENPNFVASIYAPNPKEVTYWIDLTEGPDGGIIKHWNGKVRNGRIPKKKHRPKARTSFR